MPRPGSTSKPNTGGNRIISFFQDRKEKKKRAAEEAAKKVLQNAASYEEGFISTLDSIQFHKSQLSDADLDYKTEKDQPYGDLEYTALWLKHQLETNTRPIGINIEPVDKLLCHLLDRFKQAIELGRREEAFTACKALSSSFMDVRFKLPYVLPNCDKEEYVNSLVQACVDHVNVWIDMLDQSKMLDDYQNKLESLREIYDEKIKFVEGVERKFEEAANNPESPLGKAFAEINDPTIAIADLSEDAKKLRLKLIELGVEKVVKDLTFICINQTEELKIQANGRRDTLEIAARSVSFPDDPNAMNKYKEDLKKIDAEINRLDKELEESIAAFNALEGQVKAYSNLPGATAARQEAIRQGNKMIESIKKRQEQKISTPSGSDYLRELGIKTEEELKQALKEKAEQKQREMMKDKDVIKTKERINY